MNTSPTTVDFHVHVLHEEILDLAQDKVVITGFGSIPPEDRPVGSRRHQNYEMMLKPEAQLEAMNKRKIDIHVLSSSTVIQGTFWADANEDARLCRLMNDRVAAWVAYAPDRFIGSVMLPLQDISRSLAELERCCSAYGFAIVNAPASVKGIYLGEKHFHDFWAFADRHRLTTFIHPDGVQDMWFQQFSLWNSIGQPIEETKFISSLIYEGTLDRFPDAPIVVSHGGGYAPLFMGRLNRNVMNKSESAKNIKGLPGDYLRRLFFDTCVYDAITLQRLVETVGPDRILLGSDFPVGDTDPFILTHQLTGLSAAEREAINGGTALGLVKVAPQAVTSATG
jgi:aminocarboxymuconate-semialdehyde decarboxylase